MLDHSYDPYCTRTLIWTAASNTRPATVKSTPDGPVTSTIRITASTDAMPGDCDIGVAGTGEGTTNTLTRRLRLVCITRQLGLRLARASMNDPRELEQIGNIPPCSSLGRDIALFCF